METLVACLIVVPFIMALAMSLMRNNTKLRKAITYGCGAVLSAMSIAAAVMWFMGQETLEFDLPYTEVFDKAILVGDFVLMFVVIWLSVKHKKAWISLLAIAQTCLVAALEIFKDQLGLSVVENYNIRMDWLTFIMILIIGVVGVLIGVYAVGYMHGYHHYHHKNVTDRRSFFFAVVFMFYGAMFGLVTSQNLIWIYFFWEVTSVSSFLLIGYTRTQEAIDNSFKALWMNLLGGCGIAAAIAYGMIVEGTTNLYDIIDGAVGCLDGDMALFPIAMLAFAALTKSAQFPFSGWLLGAMVAPTPSSALLHSATMVKAGVYMLVRISMAMTGNYVGQMVYLVGGFTFFAASCLAISQSDGKKVLAYSTISNLGLIVACAGAGSEETVWAATFLIMFHAVSKSMLFQCVGAIENTTGSRDIETMDGLAMRYPILGFILIVGISAMFLAPFGMLVSKWAALKAFVDVNTATAAIMVLFIAFGSATTMFYWTKWVSKILGVHRVDPGRDLTKRNEYVSMIFHAIMIIVMCLGLPVLSNDVVTPLTQEICGLSTPAMDDVNIIIMTIMIVAIIVVPVLNLFISKFFKKREVLGYMGGANAGDNVNFIDSLGGEQKLHVSSWYMTDIFGEERIFTPSVIVATVIILVSLAIIIGGAL